MIRNRAVGVIVHGFLFLYSERRKRGLEMYEYIMRLCHCGMRVDDAYTVVDDFYRELDFDGLNDFVKGYEIAHRIVVECVD